MINVLKSKVGWVYGESFQVYIVHDVVLERPF